jgi:Putative DNA-binding domain
VIVLDRVDWEHAIEVVARAKGPLAWCWYAIRGQQNEWLLVALTIRGSTTAARQTLLYDRLLIRTETLGSKVASERMRSAVTGPVRGLPAGLSIHIQSGNQPTWLTTEPDRHKQWVMTDWPGWHATFNLSDSGLYALNDMWLPAVGSKQPYFPTGFAAVDARVYGTPPFWMGTHQPAHVVIWLPDRRMRLGDVRFENGEVRVAYEAGTQVDAHIVAKAAWRMDSGEAAFSHAEIHPSEPTGWLAFGTGGLPTDFSVVLSDQGKALDRRGWSESSGRPPLNESSIPAQIANWLLEGEGIAVEFKEKLGQELNREFAESVASFANGYGGVILVGVNDHAEVTGFAADNVKDRITNIVHSYVQDYVEVETTQIEYDKRPLYVVRIPRGSSPPYQVAGKVFVRAGATDRVASPAEIRALIPTTAATYPSAPWGMQ